MMPGRSARARRDVPGHEEIELALVKLYRVTGKQKYLDPRSSSSTSADGTHSVEHPQFEPGNRFFMYNDLAYRQDQHAGARADDARSATRCARPISTRR